MSETVTHLFGIPLDSLPTYKMAEPVGTDPLPVRDSIDYELLDGILEYIKEHPKQWNQTDWYKVVNTITGDETYISETTTVKELNSCGTAMCFAGHVALAAGFPNPPVVQKDDDEDTWHRKVIDEKGEVDYEFVSSFAARRLGISFSQADALFAGDNNLEDLEFIVALLHAFPGMPGYMMRDLSFDKETLAGRFVDLATSYGHGKPDTW